MGPTLIGDGRWLLAPESPGRRTLLKGASAGALALLAAACAPAAQPTATVAPAAKPTEVPRPAAPAAQPTAASAAAVAPAGGPETVYVFNVGSRDVTLIDAATRAARETRPLGAQVRWLSNQQTYWDGSRVWTYDFPNNRLQAIAIDPQQVAVTRTIENIGTGPGHSLLVLPDRQRGVVNVAGDNVVALLNLASGEVEDTIKTGAFP